jgi:hypothetical protein
MIGSLVLLVVNRSIEDSVKWLLSFLARRGSLVRGGWVHLGWVSCGDNSVHF